MAANDADNRLWIDRRVSGGQYTIGLIYGFGLSFRLALTDGHQEDVPLQPIALLTLEVSVRLVVQPEVVSV